ncbi:hypothetical protein NPX13_g5023 [Xylaria arbuscula]|uniref:Clr5 domain-containing protein n=1 Tax=Xylaria arbuscula TaxID=114810 RepID=A0A9W8TMS3_9PEZI|nr:hypothetical protein NPX13_g5023 [Xylaria arbuscula]
MTKPWELHEATIKKLYAENTLAVVRKTMIDRYNFKASYGVLCPLGNHHQLIQVATVRRSESGSISVCSPDDSSSRSGSASPPLSPPLAQPNLEASHEFAGYSTGHGQVRDGQPRLLNPVGRTYDNTANMETPRAYTDGYNRTTHDVHGWPNSPTSTASPPTSYAQVNTIIPGPIYPYQPLSPASSIYPSMAYEPAQASCDRRQSYPLMQERQYSTSHGHSSYYSMRPYGQGLRATDDESFNDMSAQMPRHNSTG